MPINFKNKKTLFLISTLLIAGLALFVYLTTPPKQPLEVVNITPPPGVYEKAVFDSTINFTFNQPIKPSSLSFEINPPLKVTWLLKDEGKTLEFRLLEPWQANQEYVLKISESLSSVSESRLEEDIVYTYKHVPPEDYPVW